MIARFVFHPRNITANVCLRGKRTLQENAQDQLRRRLLEPIVRQDHMNSSCHHAQIHHAQIHTTKEPPKRMRVPLYISSTVHLGTSYKRE